MLYHLSLLDHLPFKTYNDLPTCQFHCCFPGGASDIFWLHIQARMKENGNCFLLEQSHSFSFILVLKKVWNRSGWYLNYLDNWDFELQWELDISYLFLKDKKQSTVWNKARVWAEWDFLLPGWPRSSIPHLPHSSCLPSDQLISISRREVSQEKERTHPWPPIESYIINSEAHQVSEE